MARVLGITGGIGTGKSTVLQMLGELGAWTLSADVIAREVLAKGKPAYHQVVERFGEEILARDGGIDRPRLADIIFNDLQARRDLNDITHPIIIKQTQENIDRFRDNPPAPDAVLAVEIPLLIECGLEHIVDEVILVAAEQETQLCRLTKRSGISREEAHRRIAAQMPIEQKISHADRVIRNDGSLESLRADVKRVWDEIHLP